MEVTLVRHSSIGVAKKAAAVCVNKEPSDKGLEVAVKSGHWSILEHISYSFLISGISRACSHQLVRHQLGVA